MDNEDDQASEEDAEDYKGDPKEQAHERSGLE